eukprot:scaffold305890_cov14-Tisochrysis_lutea.AAC.1
MSEAKTSFSGSGSCGSWVPCMLALGLPQQEKKRMELPNHRYGVLVPGMQSSAGWIGKECHVTLPLDVFTEVDQANGTLTSTTQPDPKAQSAQHHQGPSFLKALRCGVACLEHRLATASSAFVAT